MCIWCYLYQINRHTHTHTYNIQQIIVRLLLLLFARLKPQRERQKATSQKGSIREISPVRKKGKEEKLNYGTFGKELKLIKRVMLKSLIRQKALVPHLSFWNCTDSTTWYQSIIYSQTTLIMQENHWFYVIFMQIIDLLSCHNIDKGRILPYWLFGI